MSAQNSIRIALAEDNTVNRNTFQQKMLQQSNMSIIFLAANGEECLDELKGLPNNKLPQVIFVDIEMPNLNGIQTIAMGKTLYPQIHFVVLTVFDDDEKIFEAIKAGASGYLLKHESGDSLNDAITNVLEFGAATMSPAIARKALHLLSNSVSEKKENEPSLQQTISNREKEILQFTVSGMDAKRIADILGLSVHTVRKHIANIYEKLHVQSKAQIIKLAHNNKWFKL
ncbi:MAG: response regulator transcription factor [Bacteroidetes bacterium]|nr:response regulator transcription factor [Bacteroidota bacterium]